MIVTRSYVRKLEFCNLIGAFTFQYAAILLDHRKSPDPFPGGRGLGTRLAYSTAGMYYVMQGYITCNDPSIIYVVPAPLFVKGAWILRDVTYGMR